MSLPHQGGQSWPTLALASQGSLRQPMAVPVLVLANQGWRKLAQGRPNWAQAVIDVWDNISLIQFMLLLYGILCAGLCGLIALDGFISIAQGQDFVGVRVMRSLTHVESHCNHPMC